MSWYKRSRLVYNAFRNFSSKLSPKTPRITNSNSISSCHNNFKSSGICGSPSISSKFGSLNIFKHNQSSGICGSPSISTKFGSLNIFRHNHSSGNSSSLFRRNYYVGKNQVYHFKSSGVCGSPSISSKFGCLNSLKHNHGSGSLFRRNYYVDSNQVYHFKPRGYKGWMQNPKHVLIVVVVGTGVVITVYFGNSEIVPYTKRKHFVLLSKAAERQIGEHQFNEIKKSFKGKILPAIHPESVRVRLIAKDIIEALQRGLSHERVWSDPGYASEGEIDKEVNGGETLKALKEEAQETWQKKEEMLDDNWVEDNRKKGQKHGVKPSTQHMEGMKWEVLVVDEPVVNAFCLPGGKIVVFTGLLKHFKSNAEIATIVGHEIGHAVARHSAEQITKNLWFAILQLVLYQFFMPDVVNTMSNLLLKLPFSRKMEIEADYIGLLLIASAGYDPRVAPQVYEKLGKLSGGMGLENYLSTHPSGKKRAQLLAQAHVMEEALNVYREAIAGRAIEGFL